MTRQEIEANYNVNENGVITSPGKFEGEMYYSVYYWQLALDGLDDDTSYDVYENTTSIFWIDDDDKKLFPEVLDVNMLKIWEDEQGFVHCQTL